MTLQNKLSISSTVLFALTLSMVMFVTYLLFQKHTRQLYYNKLLEHANIAAYFYFEKDELNDLRYRQIEGRYRRINKESISIYKAQDKSIYISEGNVVHLNDNTLSQIAEQHELTFSTKNTQIAGLYYKDNQGDFIIVISGIDRNGNAQLKALSWMLLFSCLIGISIHRILAVLLSKRTFKPFSSLIKEVNTITTENLHSKLKVPAGRMDEMKKLIVTFNELLERLENGVRLQKNFIKNASHELKTPLTIILGNLDVALRHPRTNEEYEELLMSFKTDTLHIKAILESLLILSGLEISDYKYRAAVRMDEILWDVLEKKAIEYPEASIQVNLEPIENQEDLLIIKANRELMFIALANIVDNAIKFSAPQKIVVTAAVCNKRLSIAITDNGPGIPIDEQDFIFDIFFRSARTRHIKGDGLGLAITKQILDLHAVTLQLHSTPAGTDISLIFPSYS